MSKREYKKPTIDKFTIDNNISLILMSYGDETKPPPPPGGGAAQGTPLEQNSFESNPFEEKQ